MSTNGNGSGSGNGPPDSAGPPERVRRRRASRASDGAISVGDDPLAQLREQIDFENLSPVEEYLILLIEGGEDA